MRFSGEQFDSQVVKLQMHVAHPSRPHMMREVTEQLAEIQQQQKASAENLAHLVHQYEGRVECPPCCKAVRSRQKRCPGRSSC